MGRFRVFVVYSVIGATGAGIDLAVFAVLSNWIPYLLANVISVTLGITNNFVWNAYFNFRVSDKLLLRFLSFYGVGMIGLVLSSTLLWLLVEQVGIHLLVAKVVTIGVVVAVQFSLNSIVTFRKRGTDGE